MMDTDEIAFIKPNFFFYVFDPTTFLLTDLVLFL